MKLIRDELYVGHENGRVHKCVGIDEEMNVCFFAPVYRDYNDPSITVVDWDSNGGWSLHDIHDYFTLFEIVEDELAKIEEFGE